LVAESHPDVEQLVPELGLAGSVDELLAPISDDNPSGVDLREHESTVHEYYRLRDVRTSSRNSEREALTEGETDYLRPTDWQPLLTGVPPVLAEQSKDVELAAWLIEALTRRHGFQGAAIGFHIAARLIETYGDALHPAPDDDGVATQLAALAGLNGLGSEGALVTPLKSLPLTEAHDDGPYCTWQCEQAFELARLSDADKRESRSERGYVTPEALDQVVAQTSTASLNGIRDAIKLAISEFGRYREALDAYVPDNPQPTSRLENTLDGCFRTVNYLAGHRLDEADAAPSPASEATDELDDSNAAEGDAGPRVTTHRRISDRQTALRQLQEIAQFFRETEPHSPISYSIEQVVRWSELSLPELMRELIPDQNARDDYQTRTGIPSPEE